MILINEIPLCSIQDAIKKILFRKSEVIEFQDAERGRYDLSNMQGTPQFRRLVSKNYYRYVDNLMPRVVDSISDRLEIEGFEFYTPAKTLEKNLDLLLKKTRFDSLQKQVHNAALRDGSAYIVCQKSPLGEISMHLNTADIFEVVRDEENPNYIIGAVKFWHTCDGQRLNIYYADRVERYLNPRVAEFDALYVTRGKVKTDSFVPYTEDGADFIQKHGFTKLPVFAFINNPDNRFLGISELVSVLPIQKTLNTSLINLLVASEAWALPTRYLLGFQADYDKNGNPVPLKIESGGTWVFGDNEIKIGQLDGADLTQQLAVMNDFRIEISRISGIPLHLLGLSSDYPSGESLKVAERSLIGKVTDKQVQFGNAWEDLSSLLINLPESNYLETDWCDPAPVSPLEEAQICQLETEATKQKLENLKTAIDMGLIKITDIKDQKFINMLLETED